MVGWSCTCVTSVHATALVRIALQLRHACWVARTCRAAWGASLVTFLKPQCLSLFCHRQGLVGPLPQDKAPPTLCRLVLFQHSCM